MQSLKTKSSAALSDLFLDSNEIRNVRLVMAGKKESPLLQAGFLNLKAFLLFSGFFGHFHIFQFFNQAQQSGLQFCYIFLFKSGQTLLHAGDEFV